MWPVYKEGQMLVAERKRPPVTDDDVVVYLRPQGDDDDGERARAVLVKRLVRRTAAYTELQQFSPALTFRIENSEILRFDRIMSTEDILS